MNKKTLFSVGDIVKLKSGGPDMTIKEVLTNMDDKPSGNYKCQWFAGKKLDMGVFPHESLIEVAEES